MKKEERGGGRKQEKERKKGGECIPLIYKRCRKGGKKKGGGRWENEGRGKGQRRGASMVYILLSRQPKKRRGKDEGGEGGRKEKGGSWPGFFEGPGFVAVGRGKKEEERKGERNCKRKKEEERGGLVLRWRKVCLGWIEDGEKEGGGGAGGERECVKKERGKYSYYVLFEGFWEEEREKGGRRGRLGKKRRGG